MDHLEEDEDDKVLLDEPTPMYAVETHSFEYMMDESDIEMYERNKPNKRKTALKKYMSKSTGKPTAEIMKLAMAETKDCLGQGLLQLHEVDDDEDSFVNDLDDFDDIPGILRINETYKEPDRQGYYKTIDSSGQKNVRNTDVRRGNRSYSTDFDIESLDDSRSASYGLNTPHRNRNDFQPSDLSSASASISSVENLIQIEVNPTNSIHNSMESFHLPVYSSKENYPPIGGFTRIPANTKTKRRQTKSSIYNAFTSRQKRLSKNKPKPNTATTPSRNKFFGSKKDQDDNSKYFEQFEKDFFSFMEHDEEKQWKSVVQPTTQKNKSQQKNADTEQKPPEEIKDKTNTEPVNNAQNNHSETENRQKGNLTLPFHFSTKGYFSTLPYRKSKRKKKNLDVFSEGSKDDNSVPNAKKTTYTPAFSPRKPVTDSDKSGGLGNTIKAAFRSPSKTIDNDLLMQIFDQEKEKKWKSVVLTKEQEDKMREERDKKQKSKENEQRKQEEERQKREEEALTIKMIEEEESKAQDAQMNDKIELTVEGAFVVKSETDGSTDDVSSIRSSTPLRHVTQKFSSLRRTRSDKGLEPAVKPPLRREVTLDANMNERGSLHNSSSLISIKSKISRTSSLQNTIETYRKKIKGTKKRYRSNSTSDNEQQEKSAVKRNHSLEQVRAARQLEQQKEMNKAHDRTKSSIDPGKLWKKATLKLLKNRASKDNRLSRTSTSSKESDSSRDNVIDQDFDSYWWRTSNTSLTDEQVQLRRRHESNLLHPLWFKTVGHSNRSVSNALSHIEEQPDELKQRKNLFRRSRSWGTLMDSLEQHCYEIDDSLDKPTEQQHKAQDTTPTTVQITNTTNEFTNATTHEEGTQKKELADPTQPAQVYRNMDDMQSTENSALQRKNIVTKTGNSVKSKTMISRLEIKIVPSQNRNIVKKSNSTATKRPEKISSKANEETRYVRSKSLQYSRPVPPEETKSTSPPGNQRVATSESSKDQNKHKESNDLGDSSSAASSSPEKDTVKSNTVVRKSVGNLVLQPSSTMSEGITIDHIPFMLQMAEEQSPTYITFDKMETALAQNAGKKDKPTTSNRSTITMTINPPTVTEKTENRPGVVKSDSLQVTKFKLTAPRRVQSVTSTSRSRKVSVIQMRRQKSEIVESAFKKSQYEQNSANEEKLYVDLNEKENTEHQVKSDSKEKINNAYTNVINGPSFSTPAETEVSTLPEQPAVNVDDCSNFHIKKSASDTNELATSLESPEDDMPAKSIKYRKMMEIRHGHSTLSVPYIAVGKIKESEIGEKRKIYTSDSNAECMRAYSSDGKHMFSIAVPGCPRGLTSFTADHVLCTSCTDGHVYVIDTVRGNILRQIGQKGTLHNPRYVAMHPNNRAFVTADIRSLGKWKINMFDLRTGFATFSLAPSNHPDISIQWPGFLTFRPASDQLYVSDSESNCLFVYDVRRSAKPVFQFGKKGHGDGELLNPCGVTYLDGKFRSTGTIVVSDWGNNRISAFDPITGQFQGHVIGETNELIETPYDISTDENGGIYLTESETNYIKLFQPVYE